MSPESTESSVSVPRPDGEIHPLEQQRRDNRDLIAGLLGPDCPVYGLREDGLVTIAQARAAYDPMADAEHARFAQQPPPDYTDGRPVVKVAGRVMLKRDTGKLIWMQIRDFTSGAGAEGAAAAAATAGMSGAAAPAQGTANGPGEASMAQGDATNRAGGGSLPALAASVADLQVAISRKDCRAPGFDVAKALDLGDVVIVEGPLMKTKTGEVTIWASSLKIGTKSIAPPPEKWQGLQDLEQRYRRRYVDLYANPESMRALMLRSTVVGTIRRELSARGYLEVETPMLQTLAGGAAARPFSTHMNALSIDLFMRIAPELFLKRLLVGGMPRVFEINRNFRNEGLDKQHNPEFTMLEAYHAFGDCETVMALTEDLIRAAARAVAGALGLPRAALPFGDLLIDYERPFDRVSYGELFERALGFSMRDEARVLKEAPARHVRVRDEKGSAIAPVLIVNELFEEFAEKSIDPARPTFITGYPASISPLTRPNRADPTIADRADLFIGHMEVAPHYTELNDPDVQSQRFREQLAGADDEESTFRTYDADFIEALKVGMPPAGGMGLGIDRLCMLLLNQRTIRDVILFPMMRPEA